MKVEDSIAGIQSSVPGIEGSLLGAEGALLSTEGSLLSAEGPLLSAEGSLLSAEGSRSTARNSIDPENVLQKAGRGLRIDGGEAIALSGCTDIGRLAKTAAALRDHGHGPRLSYAAKVFVPLTRYCQSQWDYCAFISPRRHRHKVYISLDEVLEAVYKGIEVGCREALFFVAAKPEHFSAAARRELQDFGYASTHAYLAALAQQVFQHTGVLPKLHSGVLNRGELYQLRRVSVAQGLMLDSRADYFCREGEARYGSPHQHPHVRLGVVAAAGAMSIPFTSGIVIGIGESRRERIDSLLALRELHDTYGHLQETVVQDIRHGSAGGGTRISRTTLQELLWTVAVARIIQGPNANIQAPADLPPQALLQLVDAGVNDWGGISPLSSNGSGAAASQLQLIRRVAQAKGRQLLPRLPVYPAYVKALSRWVDPAFHATISALSTPIHKPSTSELAG